jgi:hypothetical protein
MKKRYFILLPAFVLLIFILAGCSPGSNDPVCDYHVAAYATGVTGPTTALVNQEIDLTVSFGVVNGCGLFESFTETTTGTTTTVNIGARYNGCNCAQVAAIRTAVYKFKRAAAGTYTLLFRLTDTTFITYSITVT